MLLTSNLNPMKTILIIAMASLVMSGCSNPKANLVSTTSKEPWIKEPEVTIETADTAGEFDLTVSSTDKAQVIDGFGGCFNELGWDALQMLDTAKQNEVMKGLFTPEGLSFNICRMPIGANDYARSYYSLNDSAGDFEMKYFNIDRDKKDLVPYIKQAMHYNPQLKIWGSPWTPPSWMKLNKHYASKADPKYNDLSVTNPGISKFTMESKYLKAYATYFVKYVRAYLNEGINVYAIHPQNEISASQIFPSCLWNAKELNVFIGEYLGPEFAKQKLETEIWLGTINDPSFAKMDTILSNSESAKFIKGIGYQWAGKEAIGETHHKYPEMKLMQSENECGDGSNDWAAAQHTWGLMKHYFSNGANSYMYWNMMLEKDGISVWGWKQNAMISISNSGKLVYNPEYYLMKHLSHFIKQGAHLLKTGEVNALSFVNPDGEIIIILENELKEPVVRIIKIDNKQIKVTLKPESFNTVSVPS